MLKYSLQDLQNWDRTLVWHGFTQMAEYEPFVVERAEGCVLVDIDGRQHIDGASSLWCNIHGHRHPKIDAAIRSQLDKVAHFTNLGGSNPTTILLAKRLVDIAPPGLRHVFFSGDGASAVEVAVKMAFQYWQQREERSSEGDASGPLSRRERVRVRAIDCGEPEACDAIHAALTPGHSPKGRRRFFGWPLTRDPKRPAIWPSAKPITAIRSAA